MKLAINFGEYKYRLFFLGLILLIAVSVGIKFSLVGQKIIWTIQKENCLLAFFIAYIFEKYVQWKLHINLRWRGPGVRRINRFILSIFAWIVCAWLALPEADTSKSAWSFFTSLIVIYMFATAWFEIFNLLKLEINTRNLLLE